MKIKIVKTLSLLCWGILWDGNTSKATAGVLASASARWNSFSFAALEDEVTPNYYGYGIGLNFGYSLAQILDIGAYGTYTPGRFKNAELFREDAQLMGYGAEVGLRIAKAVYFGVHGGSYQYNLVHQRTDDEVLGSWGGTGVGVMLGAFFPINKSKYWQVGLDFARINVTPQNDLAKAYVDTSSSNEDEAAAPADTSKTRQIDSIAVNLTYLLNGYVNSRESGGLFDSFLDSMF